MLLLCRLPILQFSYYHCIYMISNFFLIKQSLEGTFINLTYKQLLTYRFYLNCALGFRFEIAFFINISSEKYPFMKGIQKNRNL